MRIKKIDGTFNDYRVEMSFGQLKAIRDALEEFHADPILDELYNEITWYLQNIPGPGEDEEEFKAREQGEQGLEGEGGEGAAGALPPPPEDEASLPPEGGLGDEGLPEPPMDELGGEGMPGEGVPGEGEVEDIAAAGLEGGAPEGMGEGPEMTPGDRAELERRIPTPPAE